MIGLLLNDLIEDLLGENIHAVVGALVVGAVVMLIVERWRERTNKHIASSEDGPTVYNLAIHKALMIGCIRCSPCT